MAGKREGCRYVFNLVKETLDLDDAEALYKARNNATKCINQSLAVVGEQIGLPFSLSMHAARHSFAVFALNKGLSMSVVSRLLGHSSTDITEGLCPFPAGDAVGGGGKTKRRINQLDYIITVKR